MATSSRLSTFIKSWHKFNENTFEITIKSNQKRNNEFSYTLIIIAKILYIYLFSFLLICHLIPSYTLRRVLAGFRSFFYVTLLNNLICLHLKLEIHSIHIYQYTYTKAICLNKKSPLKLMDFNAFGYNLAFFCFDLLGFGR